MRDRDLLNENYYGAYGHNRNQHNSGFGNNDRDWDSRASDEARSWSGNNEADHRGRMDEQRNFNQNSSNSNSPSGYSQQSNYIPNPNGGGGRHYTGPRDYDRFRSARGRIGFTDENRRSYNSHSMYAIPGPDPDTGLPAYYPDGGNEPHENHDRGLGTQFADEVRSWFGNSEAARRRRMDARESLGAAYHGNEIFPDHRNNDLHDRYYDNDRDRDWIRNHNINNGW